MIKITLKNRKKPVKLKMSRDKFRVKGEIFDFKALYYILLDEDSGVANVYNIWTHIKYKMNDKGYYLLDKQSIVRLKNNESLICEEVNSQMSN